MPEMRVSHAQCVRVESPDIHVYVLVHVLLSSGLYTCTYAQGQ